MKFAGNFPPPFFFWLLFFLKKVARAPCKRAGWNFYFPKNSPPSFGSFLPKKRSPQRSEARPVFLAPSRFARGMNCGPFMEEGTTSPFFCLLFFSGKKRVRSVARLDRCSLHRVVGEIVFGISPLFLINLFLEKKILRSPILWEGEAQPLERVVGGGRGPRKKH